MEKSLFISLPFCGAVLGCLGVISGASAAHGAWHDQLQQAGHLEAWQTALLYQWFHALAFLAVGKEYGRFPVFALFWFCGVICFSGSIYFLCIVPSAKWAGPITPLGGILLIIGWILLAWKSRPSYSHDNKNTPLS